MPAEKTLVILKPDCLNQHAIGKVLERFEQNGFEIVACKMTRLTTALLREHYAHLAKMPFFPEIEIFMGSRSVLILILKGDRAVDRVRELLGPTDSAKAPKGTIRGDLGTDKMANICHASDSATSAAAEIQRFFRADEIFG
ncbi:MAG TPA: nucleoside-diphosphate kinase [Opitutales bacterium]|jgi:nucleoside-diphosphate kinase|nr:nucleoside-diphosphate kinase [Opitutales bacterium]